MPTLTNNAATHDGSIQWVRQEATVVDICEPYRDHGILTYPCYRLDRPIDHAFSGGPVFYDGALAGVVSAGFDALPEEHIPPYQYVASLWPLALMKCHLRNETNNFSDLFENGTIVSRDWPQLRHSIQRRKCDLCLAKGEKHPYHAERT